MAIDSRRKRGSVLGLPPLTIHPPPDGTIDAQDKEIVSWIYGGITVGAPSGIVTTQQIVSLNLDLEQTRALNLNLELSLAVNLGIEQTKTVTLELT